MSGWDSLVAVLTEARAHGLVSGEVTLEEDGEIGIDWGESARHVLSVSIGPRGRIGFSALIGDWSDHGSSETHIPDGLIIAFRKYSSLPADKEKCDGS